MKHSKLSPSGAKRWLNCPGSIRLCENIPRKDSEHSIEGTAAHALAELALRHQKIAGDLIGKFLAFDNHQVKVTEEMAEAVQIYVDFIAQLKGKNYASIESTFNLSWLIPNSKGTCDCYIYDEEEKILHVLDYKHGKGIVIYPEDNDQLKIYALGAINAIWKGQDCPPREVKHPFDLITRVILYIVQPRAYADEKIRLWETNPKDLFFWAQTVLKPGAELCEKPDAPLRSGEHCRFCPALATCPEQAKNAVAIAQTDFAAPVFPAPDMLSVNDMSKILQFSDMLSAWAEAVKERAFGLAQAGTKIPGFKLVNKKANRIWKDELEAAEVLQKLIGEKVYEKKLISVAQAEKLTKPLGFDLGQIAEKPQAGITLAPISDRRKEVTVADSFGFAGELDILN